MALSRQTPNCVTCQPDVLSSAPTQGPENTEVRLIHWALSCVVIMCELESKGVSGRAGVAGTWKLDLIK